MLDADPKAMQKINLIAHLDWARKAAMHFIVEKPKETVLDFSQGTLRM